jgi:hypothetical protein
MIIPESLQESFQNELKQLSDDEVNNIPIIEA